MKKSLIFAVGVVLLIVGLVQAETKISGSLDVAYISLYMGGNSGGMVYEDPVFQQSVTISVEPLGLYLMPWFSCSPNGNCNEDPGDEWDYILGIHRTYGEVDIDLSYTYYNLIRLGDSVGDLHAIVLRTDFPEVMSVKTYLSVEGNIPRDKDILEGGLTYRLGGVYSPEIAKQHISLNLSVSGHDGIYGTVPDALDSARISVSTTVDVWKIGISPEFNYQACLGKSVEDGGLSENKAWWGVKATYVF